MALQLTVIDDESEQPSVPTSLPYVDDAPVGPLKQRVDALIARELTSQPPSATTIPVSPPPTTSSVPQLKRSTLATGLVATGARGQLGVRFGAAAWRERCDRAEKALVKMKRYTTERQNVLDGINKRRATQQRACESRVQRLRRRYWHFVAANRDVANELRRLSD